MGILHSLAEWFHQPREYRRLPRMVLINGLAEQPESWFCNRDYWRRDFDVKVPEFLVYDGPVLQQRIEHGLPISVPFLTDQLETYLDNFVQTPPYHLVGSSLGGQIAVEYAIRHPDNVGRMVLLCPSGVGGEERLPVVEGVRKSDFETMVASVFHDRRRFTNPGIVRHYEQQFVNRRWRKGVLRTIRGTHRHSIRDKLPLVAAPTLLIVGREDRIVDPAQAVSAVEGLDRFRLVVIPNCGHAPQIEKANLVNRLVRDFLLETDVPAESKQTASAVTVSS